MSLLSPLERIALMRAEEQMDGVVEEVRGAHRRGRQPVSACVQCGSSVYLAHETLCLRCREKERGKRRVYTVDRRELVDIVARHHYPVSVAQVSSETGLSQESAQRALSRAVDRGELRRVGLGLYVIPPKDGVRRPET